MERQITLTLSDQVYQQAEGLAKDAGRSVAELLTETLTDKMYGIVKPILSDRELEELYYQQ